MGVGLASEPSISAVVILDSDGERIAVRYYTPQYATLGTQHAFEKSLLAKAVKSQGTDEADIVIFDGLITVFRGGRDCYLFVTGDQDENEIILVDVLNTLYSALSMLMPVDRRSMMDKLDLVLLALDELVDGGVILEIEPSAIVNRVGMRGMLSSQSSHSPSFPFIPLQLHRHEGYAFLGPPPNPPLPRPRISSYGLA